MNVDTADIHLGGQVAIVTGAGRGLGRAMAQALAEAGASVAVVARSQEQIAETVDLIRNGGGQAIAIAADVTRADTVENIVAETEQKLGAVTVLVNNAGIFGATGPIWETSTEDWKQALDVNVYGPYLCSAAVLKRMVQRKQGRIINIASGAALGPVAYGHAYCVTKAALLRLTECIAADMGEFGIKVFAMDPGTVRVGITEYLLESEEGKKYAPWFGEFVANGGAVPIELCMKLVTLLASGRADHLSGRFVRVTDDIQRLLDHADRIQQEDLYTLRLGQLPS